MRCFYCVPPNGLTPYDHDDILSYEELYQVSEAAVALGVEKIRITGGEPLVRKGIIPFLSRLSSLPGLKHLAMSTNGMLLPELAEELFHTGVQRLNVSLDSLSPQKFTEITRGGQLHRVLAGLDAAEKAGFPPPKLNIVIMRGINDNEIFDFTELTRTRGNSIRFIEYMPSLKQADWQQHSISGHEILRIIGERYPLEAVDKGAYAGPSQDFRIPGCAGTIGIITAVSGHFCAECNRIRITPTGNAKGCLFSNQSIDLKSCLRPLDRDLLLKQLTELVATKPERHAISSNGYEHQNFVMSQVGG